MFQKVIKARDGLDGGKPPIVVKIAADLTHKAKEDIADVITTEPVSTYMKHKYCKYLKVIIHINYFHDVVYFSQENES